MNFKIVDEFFGAKGGSPYFGLCDEDRDTRQFQTREEAEEALEYDRVNCDATHPARGKRRSPRVSGPAEDRWGRRFMNLEVVPAHYKWCISSQDDRCRWQEALAFDFGHPLPMANGRTRHWVSYDGKQLGSVEGTDHQRWIAARSGGNLPGDFVSAYQGAHALYLLVCAADDGNAAHS